MLPNNIINFFKKLLYVILTKTIQNKNLYRFYIKFSIASKCPIVYFDIDKNILNFKSLVTMVIDFVVLTTILDLNGTKMVKKNSWNNRHKI